MYSCLGEFWASVMMCNGVVDSEFYEENEQLLCFDQIGNFRILLFGD